MADVQTPAFPTDYQKTTMKDLITSEQNLRFCIRMIILEELQMMKDSITAQGFAIAAQKQRLRPCAGTGEIDSEAGFTESCLLSNRPHSPPGQK